jgi:hypothetical protein
LPSSTVISIGSWRDRSPAAWAAVVAASSNAAAVSEIDLLKAMALHPPLNRQPSYCN